MVSMGGAGRRRDGVETKQGGSIWSKIYLFLYPLWELMIDRLRNVIVTSVNLEKNCYIIKPRE